MCSINIPKVKELEMLYQIIKRVGLLCQHRNILIELWNCMQNCFPRQAMSQPSISYYQEVYLIFNPNFHTFVVWSNYCYLYCHVSFKIIPQKFLVLTRKGMLLFLLQPCKLSGHLLQHWLLCLAVYQQSIFVTQPAYQDKLDCKSQIVVK